jgi:hypothetical protein
VLQPESGYPPHADAYDVAIVLFSGEVETLDQRVTAPAVIYYSAGEPHGMRNVGDQPARYLVFEFHVSPIATSEPMERRNERTAALGPAMGAEPGIACQPSPARNLAAGGKQLASALKRAFSRNWLRNGSA